MSKPVSNHLRTLRKRWRLTQKELAFLIGSRTHKPVTRPERFYGKPTLDVVIACELVFGEPGWKLFPDLVARIGAGVRERSARLLDTISSDTGAGAAEKRKLLRALLEQPAPDNRHV